MPNKKECSHELKYNQDKDFVFCVLCGEKWTKEYSYNPDLYPKIDKINPAMPLPTEPLII